MSVDWKPFEQFRKPVDSRAPAWTAVNRWTNEVEKQRGAERKWLAERRAASDRFLADLEGDPTRFDWTSFLALRRDREEDWSDWLAQLLGESRTGQFGYALLGAMEGCAKHSYCRPDVLREVAHEGYRADLVVMWVDGCYTHIEVKVGDPALTKTLGTAIKIEQRYSGQSRRRTDIVLILPSQLDAWYRDCGCTPGMHERVHCVTWLDVARALRSALPSTTGESLRWRVWAHAFCGAIEQDLLRLRSGADPNQWATSLSLQNLGDAMRLFSEDGANDR